MHPHPSDGCLSVWIGYLRFDLPGALAVWRSALGLPLPWLPRDTAHDTARAVARPAALLLLAGPLLGGRGGRWRDAIDPDDAEPELAAMAAALNLALVVDGRTINPGAPLAVPADIGRARRLSRWLAAGVAVGIVGALLAAARLRPDRRAADRLPGVPVR